MSKHLKKITDNVKDTTSLWGGRSPAGEVVKFPLAHLFLSLIASHSNSILHIIHERYRDVM